MHSVLFLSTRSTTEARLAATLASQLLPPETKIRAVGASHALLPPDLVEALSEIGLGPDVPTPLAIEASPAEPPLLASLLCGVECARCEKVVRALRKATSDAEPIVRTE